MHIEETLEREFEDTEVWDSKMLYFFSMFIDCFKEK